MIKNMLNKRVNKNTYIILTNIIFILSYKIGGDIAEKRNYLIRGWLDILYIGNVMTLIILGVISINLFLNSKLYSKIKNGSIKNILKTLSPIIVVIIVIVCCVGGFYVFAFTYEPEHIIDIEGKKIIAKVVTGVHHTNVDFYEPVNLFLMKGSNINSEIYNGCYDRYKK